jgi:hypothetical protein
VGNDPPTVGLAQADGEPQPVPGVAIEVLRRATPQQPEGERHIGAGRDLQGLEVEHRAGRLPFKEARPRLAVCVEPTDTLLRRGTSRFLLVGGLDRETRAGPSIHRSVRGALGHDVSGRYGEALLEKVIDLLRTSRA